LVEVLPDEEICPYLSKDHSTKTAWIMLVFRLLLEVGGKVFKLDLVDWGPNPPFI
jgi:hypothetical protein